MLPLTRHVIRYAAFSLALLTAHLAFAQTDLPPTAAPAFDVVSIRVVPPDARVAMFGPHYTADGFDSQSINVAFLIRAAFGGYTKFPTDDRVTGLPDWAKTTNFQINAKMTEADVEALKNLPPDERDQRRQAMLQTMLQSMLADRFHLKAHLESKQAPVYELVLAKGGPKTKESNTSPDSPKDRDGKPIAGSFLR